LLEITQAINNNLPEESLYKIYNFTLRANLNLNKLALFVNDGGWQCKVCFGTKQDLCSIADVELGSELLKSRRTVMLSQVNAPEELKEFDMAIPVFHKDTLLSYVFVGELRKFLGGHAIDTTFLQTITNIIMVAIENKKLARRQIAQEALNRELSIAQQVQEMLFPNKLPSTDTLKVEADYLPHHSVSGDYYDFIQISDDAFLVCIADVSGKGIPAALLMSNFQASLRILIRQTTNLKQIVQELNYVLYQNSGGGSFITFFCALYDRQQKRLSYINAGHNAPVLRDENGTTNLLEKGTIVLGAFHPLPFLEETVIDGIEKFLLFSYTDGLIETRNSTDEEFGTDRLYAFLDANQHADPTELHQRIIAELDEFKEGNIYADDVTLLTVRYGKR
jgi:phosphoserine phosphatase RsbU/P